MSSRTTLEKKAKILDIMIENLLFTKESDKIKPFTFKIVKNGAVLLITNWGGDPRHNCYKSCDVTTDPRPLEDKMLHVLKLYLEDQM